jgi:arsenate reductase (glutaredoxin)
LIKEPFMTIVYGIPNCDSVRTARAWLAATGCAYTFHDFKKHGVPPHELARWTLALGWWNLLNRQGSTWRKLDPVVRSAVQCEGSAWALMRAHPSVIRRPVVDWGDAITVGFDETAWNRRMQVGRRPALLARIQAGFTPIFTAD